MNQSLDAAVIARAGTVDGKRVLSCAAAFQLAEEFKVSHPVVGDICNKNHIKIINCQLGCLNRKKS